MAVAAACSDSDEAVSGGFKALVDDSCRKHLTQSRPVVDTGDVAAKAASFRDLAERVGRVEADVAAATTNNDADEASRTAIVGHLRSARADLTKAAAAGEVGDSGAEREALLAVTEAQHRLIEMEPFDFEDCFRSQASPTSPVRPSDP
ncbi:MAG TPA: hypothetical protein VF230_00285 [Acidimicrobiales bacterium]